MLLMFRLTFFAVAALLVVTPAFAAISESRASSTISRTREASQLSDPALPSALGAVVREALLEERYDVVWQAGTPLPGVAGAWQAPNRAQGYRTFFTERGLHVRPRSAADGDWDWSLFLTHWGRAGHTTAVRATEPAVEGSRIRYARGGLEEWYVNTDAGLEQGFSLPRPPQTSATDGPIVLDFEQSGRLRASAAAPTTLALVDGAGVRRLRFGGLLAYDADGHALDARFVVHDAGLRIEVDDRGARYPVTIDPILKNEEAKLVASSSDAMAIAWFGADVAIDGATAIVGAPSPLSSPDNGVAYIFSRTGTNWNIQARLVATDSGAVNNFGSRVALSGDRAAVAAENGSGVYVFSRTNRRWSQDQELVGLAADEGDIALDGTTLVIGDAENSLTGTANVYVESGGTWSLQQALVPNDAGSYGVQQFGYSAAIEGDRIVIGSPFGPGTEDISGTAYVFLRTGTTWVEEDEFFPSEAVALDRFGEDVAIDGDTILVGAPQRSDLFPGSGEGAAYAFVRSGSSWLLEQRLDRSFFQSLSSYGTSVALAGDVAVIGAPGADPFLSDPVVPVENAGLVHIFTRSGTSWTEKQQFNVPNLAASDQGDQLGFAVDFDGSGIIAGAYTDDVGALGAAGSAYVYTLDGASWDLEDSLFAETPFVDDNFGVSVAISGDTALVGASLDDTVADDAGAAYVFVRDGEDWSQQAKLTDATGGVGDEFGWSVALDGERAVIGAPSKNGVGGAFVFNRSGMTWGAPVVFSAFDAAAFDEFGYAVDVDGDTMVVGASGDDHAAGVDAGSVYVFFRQSLGFWIGIKLTDDAGGAGDQFGSAVALDGIQLLVGAPFDDENQIDQGSAVLLTGSLFSSQSKFVADDGDAGDLFGSSVDLETGGAPFGGTAIMGAPGDDEASPNAGAAYIYFVGFPFSSVQKILADDGSSDDAFGTSVALDGTRALVGAPFDSAVGSSAGSVYVFDVIGVIDNSWRQTDRLNASDAAPFDGFGESLDLDAGTAIVGATQALLAPNSVGAAYVIALPEPATGLALLSGASLLAALARRRQCRHTRSRIAHHAPARAGSSRR